MSRPTFHQLTGVGLLGVAVALLVGCGKVRDPYRGVPSPVQAGLNTNDLIDPPAQYEADNLGNIQELFAAAERLKASADQPRRQNAPADPSRPRRSVLCLSGGGALGLIKKVLLGSSAIPGFFPPAKIPVTVDGKTYVEGHGDGGVSAGIFFRPPYVPPERWTPEGKDLHDVDLYMIVAGKLYSDAAPLKQRSLSLAGSSVSTIIYAQTRGDLRRIYLISILTGMDYNLAVIPPEFPAPMSSTEFSRGR